MIPASLPILPVDRLPEISERSKGWFGLVREFNGGNSNSPFILTGRLGWEELTREVAGVYNNLPEEDRAIAGIYADSYARAGAIDLYGPQYGLPHAVSGSLTYYLWGPGYSWDVMILIVSKTNNMGMFFEKCELKAVVGGELYLFNNSSQPHIFVCRNPKVSAEKIWTSSKSYR
jgi:hypothetical protein